uniref:Uncharacterized protein n=2 Tax=Mus spicilegus TaxID=10103 RepID=A0A8C6MWA6_MUSSI
MTEANSFKLFLWKENHKKERWEMLAEHPVNKEVPLLLRKKMVLLEHKMGPEHWLMFDSS